MRDTGGIPIDKSIFFGITVAEQVIKDLNEKVEDELFERIAAMRGYVKERTCHKELMITENYNGAEVEFFGCSECGEYLSDTDCYGLGDGPNYCENCGCKVDSSLVTDENTGEVIYRDGEKVVK